MRELAAPDVKISTILIVQTSFLNKLFTGEALYSPEKEGCDDAGSEAIPADQFSITRCRC